MNVVLTREAGLARLVLDRPPLNILTRDALADLRAALAEVAADRTLRAALLSGSGRDFSAGADVREHLSPDCMALIPEFLETLAALDRLPMPLIAAVRGRCLGGGFELVQTADIVLAAESAVFGQPEILLAVFPPGACAYLPDCVPRGAAAELVFTGDPVDAAEAHRLGLVREVVPDARLEEAALALAARITRHSAATLRAAKTALRAGRAPRCGALSRAGRVYTDELMRTDDAAEGLQAFLEKRPPVWLHR